MPILAQETDVFPDTLFTEPDVGLAADRRWWALYTHTRREKQLARYLLSLSVPFYLPTVTRCWRSTGGYRRTSYLPLFPNYLFLLADESERLRTLAGNYVARCLQVADGDGLWRDLRQMYCLTRSGHPLTLAARLQSGQRVRICSGSLRGIEGTIIRRESGCRLIIAVQFLKQGASVLVDNFAVEPV